MMDYAIILHRSHSNLQWLTNTADFWTILSWIPADNRLDSLSSEIEGLAAAQSVLEINIIIPLIKQKAQNVGGVLIDSISNRFLC